jgi:hypothetical protein
MSDLEGRVAAIARAALVSVTRSPDAVKHEDVIAGLAIALASYASSIGVTTPMLMEEVLHAADLAEQSMSLMARLNESHPPEESN